MSGPVNDRVSRIANAAAYRGYSAGWSAVRHLPEGAAYRLFRGFADLSWGRHGPSVRRLEANLARVVGADATSETVRELSRAGVRSYFRYWCDAFRMTDWDHRRIVERVRVVHEDNLRTAMDRGRGVMVALPHMANWDHAGAWACLTVSPLATVAERLKPEELFEKFVAFRESLGMKVLPLTGGTEDTMSVLGDHLRGGGLVCLPADRDLSRRGVPVTMFGEATRMPAGPAMLSVRTGAALVPTILSYEGDEPDHRLVIRFSEPIEVPASPSGRIATMTQSLADAFAAGIADHPADWHMMQRLFLTDLRADDPRCAGTGADAGAVAR